MSEKINEPPTDLVTEEHRLQLTRETCTYIY